jgi:Velvet factor
MHSGHEPRFHAHPLLCNPPTRREYQLTVRQEPKQARMCGVGGKADRRPIDPPPIVQLRVIDPLASTRGRHNSPSGRKSTDSDDDEDEVMDDGELERLVLFFP